MANLKSFAVLGPSYANDFVLKLFVLLKTLVIAYYNSTVVSAERIPFINFADISLHISNINKAKYVLIKN